MVLSIAATSDAAALTEITDFGANPGNLGMFLYVPENVQPHPAVLVGLHWCHGTAEAYFNGNQFHTYADEYGYIMICPETHTSDQCFDVHSTETLTHDGGGASQSVASMVKWVIANKNADATRVFVAGHSGGGMMTNVMAGSYPEVFAAASASAGVPFGCFAGGDYTWNDDCAKGKVTRTAEEWKELVLAAYPGYTGPRPRMQLWHGANDDVLYPANFDEEVKQWTGVLGVSQPPSTTETNTPFSDYTRTRYKDASGTVLVEAVKGLNQPHNIKISDEEVIRFFDLDKTVGISPRQAGVCNQLSETVSIRKCASGRYNLAVNTHPGLISAALYDCRGRRMAIIGEHNSGSGNTEFNFTLSDADHHHPVAPAVYMVCVKVNGSVIYAQPLTF